MILFVVWTTTQCKTQVKPLFFRLNLCYPEKFKIVLLLFDGMLSAIYCQCTPSSYHDAWLAHEGSHLILRFEIHPCIGPYIFTSTGNTRFRFKHVNVKHPVAPAKPPLGDILAISPSLVADHSTCKETVPHYVSSRDYTRCWVCIESSPCLNCTREPDEEAICMCAHNDIHVLLEK